LGIVRGAYGGNRLKTSDQMKSRNSRDRKKKIGRQYEKKTCSSNEGEELSGLLLIREKASKLKGKSTSADGKKKKHPARD